MRTEPTNHQGSTTGQGDRFQATATSIQAAHAGPEVATSMAPLDDRAPTNCLAIVKGVLKGIGIVLGLVAAFLPAASCWAEAWLSRRDELFLFWGQSFALAPGLPGAYLRKCFYHLTLRSCSLSCTIGFLKLLQRPTRRGGRAFFVGAGVGIGLASLGDGCLIGSRVGIFSGGDQHRLGPDGRLTPFDRAGARRVRVGEETWIGEAAILMADVGCRCIVSAGAVISNPVPDGCLIGGNPARFVRKLI